MDTWIWIIIVIVALVGCAALGFYLARQYMMKYLKENPPINEQMIPKKKKTVSRAKKTNRRGRLFLT